MMPTRATATDYVRSPGHSIDGKSVIEFLLMLHARGGIALIICQVHDRHEDPMAARVRSRYSCSEANLVFSWSVGRGYKPMDELAPAFAFRWLGAEITIPVLSE